MFYRVFNPQNSVVRMKVSSGHSETRRATACSLLLDSGNLHLLPESGDCFLCLTSSFETFQVAINPTVRKAPFQVIVEKQLHSVFIHLWLFAKNP